MTLKKSLFITAFLAFFLTFDAAFSKWDCCSWCSSKEDDVNTRRSGSTQNNATPQQEAMSTVQTMSASSPLLATAARLDTSEASALAHHMSPPTPPRMQTDPSIAELERLGLSFRSLVASNTEVRVQGNSTDITFNALLNDNERFLYAAIRSRDSVNIDEGSVDQYLLQTPTAGIPVTVTNALEALRQQIRSLDNYEVLNQFLGSAENLIIRDGQSTRRLIDASDQSVYFFTQNASSTTAVTRVITLGLIQLTNANFGITVLPSERRLSPSRLVSSSARRQLALTDSTEEKDTSVDS